MARKQEPQNGRLEEAMLALVQSQAILTQAHASLTHTQAECLSQMAEYARQHAETVRRLDAFDRHCMERFSRIEAILIEHSRILQALPDAVREKIGFKPAPQQA